MTKQAIIYKKSYSKSSTGYYIENIQTSNPSIDLGVDATYIIHLMHNGRLKSINNELSKYSIKGKNYILFNEGYKCGKKGYNINGPALDLIDAFLYVIEHAIKENHENILILEDDFFFDKLILQSYHQRAIKKFIKNNSFDLYLLGCLPFISKEINNHTSRLYASTGTHAVIYSREFMELTLKSNQNSKLIYNISDWDTYTCVFKNYMYNIPLCYQLFPATQNRNEWGKGIENTLFLGKVVKQFVKAQINCISLMHLDKTHLIGYPVYYNMSKLNYTYIENLYNKSSLHKINLKLKNIKERLYKKWYFQKLLTA